MQGEVIFLWIYMKNEDILDTSPPGSGRVERGVSVSLPEEDREGGGWSSLHRQRLRVDRSEPGLSLRRCYLELETNLREVWITEKAPTMQLHNDFIATRNWRKNWVATRKYILS